MKRVVCELCGSNELKKEGDDFVCQYCGTRYTPEAAKKLLVDVQISGTVQVDGITPVDEIVARARQEEQAGHLCQALEYYERAEAVSPMSQEAQDGIKRINEAFLQREGFDGLVALGAGAVMFVILLIACVINRASSFWFMAGIVLIGVIAYFIYSFMRGISIGKGLAKEDSVEDE